MQYLHDLVAEYKEFLQPEARTTAVAQISTLKQEFRPRQEAFFSPCAKLTEYLQENSVLFSTVASELDTLPSLQWALRDS